MCRFSPPPPQKKSLAVAEPALQMYIHFSRKTSKQFLGPQPPDVNGAQLGVFSQVGHALTEAGRGLDQGSQWTALSLHLMAR